MYISDAFKVLFLFIAKVTALAKLFVLPKLPIRLFSTAAMSQQIANFKLALNCVVEEKTE